MTTSPWMTVAETAAYTRRHVKTCLAALRRGELVGSQARVNACWRVHRDDADRWIRGERPARRRRAA